MISQKNIPVLILAGGMGTRISEESQMKPKPMIEIGEVPILIHIMRWYYSFGFNDFVICAGYRSWDIKEYFLNYELLSNNLVIDHREETHRPPFSLGKNLKQENWRVQVIDTGLESMTGARVALVLEEISKRQSIDHFALTYGDGVADVNLNEELDFHMSHGRVGTVLGVPPPARFGELDISEKNEVLGFLEKPESKTGLINGGFFFFKKEFGNYLSTDKSCILERAPLSRLATEEQLMVYKHPGFWQPMDTLRDKFYLQSVWESGNAPWKPKDISG